MTCISYLSPIWKHILKLALLEICRTGAARARKGLRSARPALVLQCAWPRLARPAPGYGLLRRAPRQHTRSPALLLLLFHSKASMLVASLMLIAIIPKALYA